MYRFLTGEWKNCPYPCVWLLFRSKMSEATGDHHKHQLTGGAAGSLSVTCVAVEITQAAAALRVVMGGRNFNKTKKSHKGNKTWTETL